MHASHLLCHLTMIVTETEKQVHNLQNSDHKVISTGERQRFNQNIQKKTQDVHEYHGLDMKAGVNVQGNFLNADQVQLSDKKTMTGPSSLQRLQNVQKQAVAGGKSNLRRNTMNMVAGVARQNKRDS